MNAQVPAPGCLTQKRLPALTVEIIGEILLESAGEALLLAFMVQLLGGIAVGIVGDICREMTPSLPSPLARKPALESNPTAPWNTASAWLHDHRFALLFALFFIAKSAARLLRYSEQEAHLRAAASMNRVLRTVSSEWFGVVVGNAFTTWGITLALQFSQAFSWTQLLWSVLAELFRPAFQMAGLLPGAHQLESFFDWYQSNQLKFTFWLLYSAAVCDDLGLPNYKTLGRRLWRRWRQHPAQPTPIAP